MRLRLLFSTLAAFVLLGAGCTRATPSSPLSEAQPEAQPLGVTPRAEAPILPSTEVPSAALPDTAIPTKNPAAQPATSSVMIRGFSFLPTEVRIKAGDTVRWRQEDSIPHNVAADDGSFIGPLLSIGQMYTRSFTQKGVFSYYCQPHPWMKGRIIVE